MDFIDYINTHDCPQTPETYNFNSIIIESLDKFVKVTFFEDELIAIKNNISKISQGKFSKRSNEVFQKKAYNNYLGKLAASMLLEGFKLNTSASSKSSFELPDLTAKYNLGITSAEWGNFPLVDKDPKRQEIITLIHGNEVYLCGIANCQVLKENSTEDLVLSPRIRIKGNKVGFHGFSKLNYFNKEKADKKLKELM